MLDLEVDNSAVIPDSSFTASSWKCMSTPSLANVAAGRKCYAAWCGSGSLTWLQIDAKHKRVLAFMSTKGPTFGNPVTSFYLTYSLDGTNWQNYTQGGVRLVSCFPSVFYIYFKTKRKLFAKLLIR